MKSNSSCYAPAPNKRGIKRCFCLTSVCLTSVCLSHTSGLTREQTGIGRGRLKLAQRHPMSRMNQTPLSRSKGQRATSPGRFAHCRVGASGGCGGGRGNVLAVENCCYIAVCLAAQSASAPTGGGEGRGHTVAAVRLQLVFYCNFESCSQIPIKYGMCSLSDDCLTVFKTCHFAHGVCTHTTL